MSDEYTARELRLMSERDVALTRAERAESSPVVHATAEQYNALVGAMRDIAVAMNDSEADRVGGAEYYSMEWFDRICEVLERFGHRVDVPHRRPR